MLALACAGCDLAVSALATATPNEAAIQFALRQSPEEIQRAIHFREGAGLRSDEPWVRQVAADPDASMEWSVPLTAAEAADIDERNANAEGVGEIVATYGDSVPNEYGGVYLDQEQRGIVTVLFTGNLAAHETRLRSLLRLGTRFTVRQVRWPERILRELQDRIAKDADWMRKVDAVMQSIGVDVAGNFVELRISSKNPRAPALIAEHFHTGEMLHVTSDGTGVALMPTGTIRGRAVDRLGRPVPGLDVTVVSDIPGAGLRGDVGYLTREDGRFELRGVHATGFEVQLKREAAGGVWKVVGRRRVVVPAGGVAFVLIVVQEP